MRIYNSLTRQVEEFKPIKADLVTIYTCGPTVYDYASIGNFRTYTTSDFLIRALKFEGYKVKFVMNLTDVGHLTGDNEGDADTGEDRLEKGAKREGKSAWDIAKFYSEAFIADFEKLNLTKPESFTKATEHISEQIDLVKKLEENGFTYKISDGIYFDTVEFESQTGKKYGELSDLDQIKEGARVEPNPEKKNPRDFALWKFSDSASHRQMEWESPWGLGFPGWHIECSAMSMKYLGETLDIHVGGEDLKQTHHPNEIAQSEGATGKKFVNYWVHGRFLQVDGKRMGKSLGNFYTVSDIAKKGYDPLALRYLYMTSHYRDSMNFTWQGLDSAASALENLRGLVREFRELKDSVRTRLSEEKMEKISSFQARFREALDNDLNMPQALAVLWEVAKSNIPNPDKLDLFLSFDEVFGLEFSKIQPSQTYEYETVSGGDIRSNVELTANQLGLIEKRNLAKRNRDFSTADSIREELEHQGILIKDTQSKTVVESVQ